MRRRTFTTQPVCHLRNLPAALTAMPALRELELHGVSYMSADHEQELSVATAAGIATPYVALSCDERSLSEEPAPVLYMWLAWALPAATQLRKLSVSCGPIREWEGDVPPCWTIGRSPVSHVSVLSSK